MGTVCGIAKTKTPGQAAKGRPAGQQNLSPVRRQKAHEKPQGGGLARPVFPDQADDFPFSGVKGDVIQRCYLSVGIGHMTVCEYGSSLPAIR